MCVLPYAYNNNILPPVHVVIRHGIDTELQRTHTHTVYSVLPSVYRWAYKGRAAPPTESYCHWRVTCHWTTKNPPLTKRIPGQKATCVTLSCTSQERENTSKQTGGYRRKNPKNENQRGAVHKESLLLCWKPEVIFAGECIICASADDDDGRAARRTKSHSSFFFIFIFSRCCSHHFSVLS